MHFMVDAARVEEITAHIAAYEKRNTFEEDVGGGEQPGKKSGRKKAKR
jgi:hypothetical protein